MARVLWAMLLLASLASLASAQDVDVNFDVGAHYDKVERTIAMRDGVKLYTVIYSPKDRSQRYPILLTRTPYSAGPYGAGEFRGASKMAPSQDFLREGYIFVFQDGRGTWKSEGVWENLRPVRTSKDGTDESTDAWDSIDWLVKHVDNNNGRVGQWGISHPGWYTVMGMIEPHPALKAASPQATTFDAFIGDDDHRNGAFALTGSEWWRLMSIVTAPGRDNEANGKLQPIDIGAPWDYDFFLKAGPTDELNQRHFGGRMTQVWQNLIEHPNYDVFWASRNVRKSLGHIKVPVLNVMGWFDAFDPYGAVTTYHAIEEHNPRNRSVLVAGPWSHGGWQRDSSQLGDIRFGSNSSEYFQKKVMLPFFEYHLKDKGKWSPPEVLAFETGANRWHEFAQWPPREVVEKKIYFGADGHLSFTAPQAGSEAHDDYVSDPAHPVPYTSKIQRSAADGHMVGDQRYASTRPDVLTYQTDILTADITIAGPVLAQLFASTSGSDSDWYVKLIDVYPGDAPDNEPNPQDVRMGGYQMLVGIEVMRGKYRNSFAKPEAMVKDEVTPIRFEIRDKFHTFKKGHRLMVQVQSSWFPIFDRNPQTFTNIYRAKPEEYRKATQRIYRSSDAPSHLVLPLLP